MALTQEDAEQIAKVALRHAPIITREEFDQIARYAAAQVVESAAQEIARRAAEQAVDTVFLKLGLDTSDHESIKQWNDNLAFLSRMNRGARQVSKAATTTCAGAVVTGLIWLIITGLKEWLHMG